ncbi:MAG: hypothetical protein JSR42_00515 [Proteobacteria bacterium]|nr:hypothetical protein [Pseudomonadota bacterium]
MNRMLGIAAGIGLGMISATPSIAQTAGAPADTSATHTVATVGDVQFFAGIRLWANEWDFSSLSARRAVDPSNPSNVVLRDEVVSDVSDVKFVPMPTFGARYGNFLGSITYFVPTSYSVKGVLSRDVKRSELDVTAGYFVLPSLLLSIGYKHAKVDRLIEGLDSGQDISAILLGLSASAPLSDRLSLYGNFAYGLGRQKSDSPDPRGKDRYSSTYAIGEVGLSYRILEGRAGMFVKSLTGSIGYRAQSYTTKDVGLGTYAMANPNVPIATTTRDVQTSTNGVVVALVASF